MTNETKTLEQKAKSNYNINDEDKFIYEETYNEMQELPDKILIEDAQDFKYANLATKLRAVLLPEFYLTSKEIAKDILTKRGINYKVRQKERYGAKKRANRIYWNKLKKEILTPLTALYNHVTGSCNQIHNSEKRAWRTIAYKN